MRALLEGRRGAAAATLAARLTGSADLFDHRGRRPWATRSISSPRTTASRCRTWSQLQRQAQRGQRRGQPRRRQPTTCQLELRRRGADRRSGDPRRCAARRSATCWPRCCFAQGVPMLLAGDEIGRTPERQQQRLLPGQRDVAGSTGRWRTPERTLLGFTRAPDRAAATHPGPAPPRLFLHGRSEPHAGIKRHRLVQPRGAEMIERNGTTWHTLRSACSAGRRRAVRLATERGADDRASAALQCHHDGVARSRCPRAPLDGSCGWTRLIDTAERELRSRHGGRCPQRGCSRMVTAPMPEPGPEGCAAAQPRTWRRPGRWRNEPALVLRAALRRRHCWIAAARASGSGRRRSSESISRCEGAAPQPMTRGRRLVRGGHRHARAGARYAYQLQDGRACPTRRRAFSPTTCMAPARWSTRAPTNGGSGAGAGGPGKRR